MYDFYSTEQKISRSRQDTKTPARRSRKKRQEPGCLKAMPPSRKLVMGTLIACEKLKEEGR